MRGALGHTHAASQPIGIIPADAGSTVASYEPVTIN